MHTTPTTYHKCNARQVQRKIPVPGRILVPGFSYLEASAKFISYFGYSILKELLTPLTFQECRVEYEYLGLNMALKAITTSNLNGPPTTIIELDLEGCYPSIKHENFDAAFKYFFEFVPEHLLNFYINVWARVLYLLNHKLMEWYINKCPVFHREVPTSNSSLFLLIWTKFTTSIPARGYTQEICDMILKKILRGDITTDTGHAMIRHSFGFISHNL